MISVCAAPRKEQCRSSDRGPTHSWGSATSCKRLDRHGSRSQFGSLCLEEGLSTPGAFEDDRISLRLSCTAIEELYAESCTTVCVSFASAKERRGDMRVIKHEDTVRALTARIPRRSLPSAEA